MSGLNLSYGRLRALSDINLTVQSGELVALAGENRRGQDHPGRAAIGGNAEASRRAAINLNRIRVAAFALAG